MNTRTLAAALGLPLLILAACGPGTDDVAPPPAAPGPQVHVARGEVVAVAGDVDPPTLTLQHEAIDGYMDAMTMEFVVGDGVSMAAIAEGDKVRFTLTVDAAAAEPVQITAVEKLPAEVELEIVAEEPPAP